jgi:hypothetical protein
VFSVTSLGESLKISEKLPITAQRRELFAGVTCRASYAGINEQRNLLINTILKGEKK